ncbi:MAG: endonuclease III domain-containing protein [Bacteroidota bacterium]
MLYILLSTRTRGVTFSIVYDELRMAFPENELLAKASEAELATVLRRGGLANRKASQLRRILDGILEAGHGADLWWLDSLGDEDAEAFLTSLPGVGIKIARCIMMYSLHRKVFPVDTHVRRISYRLGWIASPHKSRKSADLLQAMVPPDFRFSLHVNMVCHGRQVCRGSRPACSACVLEHLCPKQGVNTRGETTLSCTKADTL